MRIDSVLWMLLVFSGATRLAAAQSDSTTHISRAYTGLVLVGTTVALDAEIREYAVRERGTGVRNIVRATNPLGTGKVLLPAMTITYILSRADHDTVLSRRTLKTLGAYGAANAAESILKPIIGRQRPNVAGNSHRFRPFARSGDWHSFPSAHVAHISAVATAIATQSESRPLAIAGDILVGLVSADRVYEDQHWTSDVTLTALVTPVLTRAVLRLIDSRWPGAR